MFTGESEEEIAEKDAEFFNSISREYTPITPANNEITKFLFVRMKKMGKTKGMLNGDIDPRLNEKFCNIIAFPLAQILREIANSGEWPRLWKSEQVTEIPKNNCPGDLSELRNLSCTPFY